MYLHPIEQVIHKWPIRTDKIVHKSLAPRVLVLALGVEVGGLLADIR
jgi:hypothetical protein